METDTLVESSRTTIKKIQHGKHYLVVHEKYVDGKLIGESFTLDSLMHCMGMAKSTMEGRYSRGRLCNWKLDIPNGYGRPARGFPLALLPQVEHILLTPGASVKVEPNRDTIRHSGAPRPVSDLRPTYFMNQPHYTIPSLAEHFGYSETTIRKKLEKSGLLKKQVDLGPSVHGGRPKRGFPQSMLGHVRAAICENVSFRDRHEAVLARTSGLIESSQREILSHITPHTPPLKDSMREWDNDSLAPVVPIKPLAPSPVNAVKRLADYDAMAQDLAAELEAIMNNTTQVMPTQVPTKAPPPAQPVVEDDAATIKQKAWAWQLEALSSAEEEPTDGDLRDTCEMMELDKAESERFVSEVFAARAGRAVA